jgi:hypothetical protein
VKGLRRLSLGGASEIVEHRHEVLGHLVAHQR